MKIPFLVLTSSLVVFSLLSGCSSQTQIAKQSGHCGTSGETDCTKTQSTKGDVFSTRLNEYLGALAGGGGGEKFWCAASESMFKAPIAVRSSKVLQAEEHKYTEDFGNVNGKLFVLQMESATKGGSPIVKNWLLSMSTEASGTPCIRTLYEKD